MFSRVGRGWLPFRDDLTSPLFLPIRSGDRVSRAMLSHERMIFSRDKRLMRQLLNRLQRFLFG